MASGARRQRQRRRRLTHADVAEVRQALLLLLLLLPPQLVAQCGVDEPLIVPLVSHQVPRVQYPL